MSRIYHWFMDDVSHFQMGFARILLGFCFLGAYATRAPYAQFLYGPHGFAGMDFYEMAGTQRFLSSGLGRWLALFGTESFVNACYILLLVSAFCLMVGFKSRFFGILVLILHVTFDQRNVFATAGWSKLAHSFLLYVILSRGGDVWSVDAFLKKRKSAQTSLEPVLASAWPIRLLQIHVCTMYFVSAWPRLGQDIWIKGYAVIFTFLHNEHSRFSSLPMIWTGPLKAMDWMAMIVEPFAFIALWLPTIGPIWALALCLMHVGLEITTHVDWWNFLMIAGLASFLPEAWLRLENGKVTHEDQARA